MKMSGTRMSNFWNHIHRKNRLIQLLQTPVEWCFPVALIVATLPAYSLFTTFADVSKTDSSANIR